MKKVFLALMAIAAIALTGCKDRSDEPNTSGEQKEQGVRAMAYSLTVNDVFLTYCTDFKIEYTMPNEEPKTEAVQWVTDGDYKTFKFIKEVPSKGKASIRLICKRNDTQIDETIKYDIVINRAVGFGVVKTIEDAASELLASITNLGPKGIQGDILENSLASKIKNLGTAHEYTFEK